jgi:hypothetical protein
MKKDPRRNQLAQRIAPGFWVDKAGHGHVSIKELLDLVELPDTPENRAQVTQMVRELILKNDPNATFTERQTPDD